MKYFIKFINLVVSINLISNQFLLSSLIFKTNQQAEIWENNWNEMYPIILKNHNVKWNDLETVKNAINSEIEDIVWRFPDDKENYKKSGYHYPEDNKNIIYGFLSRNEKQLKVNFLYHPDIQKEQIINKMTALSLNEVVIINDEKLLEDKEFLKNELYKRVSGKVIIDNKNNISISKKRFKWIRTDHDLNNLELYTAYFNYFNNQDLVPLKIWLFKMRKKDDFPDEIFEINSDNNEINVKTWFVNVFAPILLVLFVFGLSIFKTAKIGISKFITSAISFFSSFRNNILRDFQTGSIGEPIDDFMNFSNSTDELTRLLPRTEWQLDTTTTTTVARKNSVELLVSQEYEIWKQNLEIPPILKNNEKFTNNKNTDVNLVFKDFLEKLEPYSLTHNMNYLEWSNLDPYKIGKISFNNSDFKISFPIKNPNFTKPSLEMINNFKTYISKKLENVVFNSKEINSLSKSLLFELIQSYLLVEPNLFTFKNQKYKFSIDSFWIEKFEITDKLTIYLNHLLFKQALKIELKLF